MSEARAFDVNVHQQIVGRRDMNGAFIGDRGFVFADGTYSDLGDLLNSNHVDPSGVNDLGQICGYTNNSSTGPLRAFLWENGSISAIQLPLGENSIARDINNVSQVVGWMGPAFGPTHYSEAFLWQAGDTISLGVPPGGTSSQAVAISDNGHVAGTYWIEVRPKVNELRGFHWRDGIMTLLVAPPGFHETIVRSVNDRGEIVGWFQGQGSNVMPFIWRDGVMTDLRTIVDLPAGYTLVNARDINNQGQILGSGRDNNNDAVGYRLTPFSKIPGDYDCDHVVDIDDLLGVIGHWGPVPGGGNAPADFNGDHIVNVADLLIVITNWTF